MKKFLLQIARVKEGMTCCMVMLAATCGLVHASEIEMTNYLKKADIITGAKIEIFDGDNHETVLPAHYFQYFRTVTVRLEYTRDSATDVLRDNAGWYMQPWTYKVNYAIYESTDPNGSSSVNAVLGELEVRFLPGDLVYDADLQYPQNWSQVTIEVMGVTAFTYTSVNSFDPGVLGSPIPVSTPETSILIPGDIQLRGVLKSEKYMAGEYAFATNLLLGFKEHVQDGKTDYRFFWNFIRGAESFEMEYVFIDKYDHFPSFTSTEDPFLVKEPVRITTPWQFYSMEPAFPEGKLYIRVRPVNYKYAFGAPSPEPYYGPWSYLNKSSNPVVIEFGNQDDPANYKMLAYEEDLNWHYTAAFAEKGKTKHVISYFDDILRSRQSITNLSTDMVSVIGETKYDREGRQAVTILPTPDDISGMKYRSNFNQNISAQSFEAETFEDWSVNNTALAGSTGAGVYYSNSNPFMSLPGDHFTRFTAVADGYAYTQVEYTRDGTGRISRQSGVGDDHRLGNGHETRMFYGTPASTELHRMFGSNVGIAAHYKKNMTLDANGQVSIAYYDQAGKVIATALAGANPENLIRLDDNIVDNITVNMTANNVVDVYNGISVIRYPLLNVNPNTTYDFTYSLHGNSLSTAEFCVNCKYVLDIDIRDPEGVQVATVNQVYPPPSTSCTVSGYTPPAETLSVMFTDIGNYTVTKTLRVIPLTLDEWKNEISDKITHWQDSLEDHYLSLVDTLQCDMTCEQHCRSQVLLANPAWAADPVMYATQIQAAIDDCMAMGCDGLSTYPNSNYGGVDQMLQTGMLLQCEGMKQNMITQMSQYATTAKVVLQQSWNDGDIQDDFDNNGLEVDVNDPVYGSITIDANWLNTDPLCGVGCYSLDTLAALCARNDELAQALVHHHREYCHYLYCTDPDAVDSRIFDVKMAMVRDWQEGISTGYINPDGLAPGGYGFVNSQDEPYYPSPLGLLDDNILNLPSTGNDIWYEALNFNYSMNGTLPYTTSEQQYMFWRGLYMGQKQLLTEDHIENTYGCTYFDDTLTINRKTPDDLDPMSYNMNNWFNQFNDELPECDEICEENVDNWINQLAFYCQPFAPQDEVQLRFLLLQHCNNSCGGANIMGILTTEDLLAATVGTPLYDAMALLGTYSCSFDEIAISSSDFYTQELPYSDDPAVHCYPLSIYTPLGCIDELTDLLNALFPASSSPSSADYDPMTSCPVFVGALASDGSRDHVTNEVLLPCGPLVFCYKTPGGGLDIMDLDDIASFGGVIGDFTPPAPTYLTYQYMGVKMYVQTLQNTVVPVWVYSSRTECMLATLETDTVCITEFPVGSTTVTISWEDMRTDCIDRLKEQALIHAQQHLQELVEDYVSQLESTYYATCMPAGEDFYVTYEYNEYHYTLYYYDQAGNLVQTIPPQGFVPVTTAAFDAQGKYNGTSQPTHRMITRYKYNSLNQPVHQSTPDGGSTAFYYDHKGLLKLSQNAKQAAEAGYVYSATMYDRQYRIETVCKISSPGTSAPPLNIYDLSGNAYTSWWNGATKTEVTHTHYDTYRNATVNGFFGAQGQQHLRGRVATIAYADAYADITGDTWNSALHYSYDIHGNVQVHILENTSLPSPVQRFTTEYVYDLISGNVHQVSYQAGKPDAFYHRYWYDADNRIKEVYTSRDGVHWEQDARYFYYIHGGLARFEIGNEMVQGVDYTYTKHGWLKTMNSGTLFPEWDMGKDGAVYNGGHPPGLPTLNWRMGRDAASLLLGYYQDDYISLDGSNAHLAIINGSPVEDHILELNSIKGLWNGNIPLMISAIFTHDDAPVGFSPELAQTFQYDQLNRLRKSFGYTESSLAANNTWGAPTDDIYDTEHTYDRNGNLLTLNRREGSGTWMDELEYGYLYDAGLPGAMPYNTNKLGQVTDNAIDLANYDDFKSSSNYLYDEIGNLVEDGGEEIGTIEWTVYGKVKKVTRITGSAKPDLEFTYAPDGQRLSKTSKCKDANGNLVSADKWVTTLYSRDAQGNMMAVYMKTYNSSEEMTVAAGEYHIYGSARLGMLKDYTVVYTEEDEEEEPEGPVPFTHVMGKKQYELTNHLGNVLATVSDVKLGYDDDEVEDGYKQSSGSDGLADYYMPYMYTATQYYPFGSPLPGRDFVLQSTCDTTVVNDTLEVVNEAFATGVGGFVSLNAGGTVSNESGQLKFQKTCTTPGCPAYGGDRTFTQVSGETYTVKFDLSLPGTCSPTVTVKVLDPSNGVISTQTYNTSGTKSFTFTTTAGGTGKIEFSATTCTVFYIDNLNIGYTAQTTCITCHGGYRFGFNGMEKTDEWQGGGMEYDFGARMYDPRVGRFLSLDPLGYKTPFQSAYTFAKNSPILLIDAKGLIWENPYRTHYNEMAKIENPTAAQIQTMAQLKEYGDRVDQMINELRRNDPQLYDYINNLQVTHDGTEIPVRVPVYISDAAYYDLGANSYAKGLTFTTFSKDATAEYQGNEIYAPLLTAPNEKYNAIASVGSVDVTVGFKKGVGSSIIIYGKVPDDPALYNQDRILSNEAGDVMYSMEYNKMAYKGVASGTSSSYFSQYSSQYSFAVEDAYMQTKKGTLDEQNKYPLILQQGNPDQYKTQNGTVVRQQ